MMNGYRPVGQPHGGILTLRWRCPPIWRLPRSLYSFGLRLPQLGPMENADMVGTDLTYNIHDYILKDLEDSHEPSPLLRQLRDEGKIGFKTGEGFQKWTPDQVAQSNAELNEYLIRMLYGK